MRALQITELTGPDTALKIVDVPEPEPSHFMTPGSGVLVDVEVAGVSFPEVLQTRGEYQVKPPLPFIPGSEVGGIVRSAPEGAAVQAGDRVAAFCMLGGFAEVVVAPEFMTFKLPDALDFAQGAALILNYHTAYFALKLRGRLAEGETRARARRGRRRRHGGAAGRQGPGRQDDRGRLQRREGVGRARGGRRRGRALRPAPGRTRSRSCRAAASTSSSTRSAAIASPTRCGRCARAAGSSSSASPAARSPR